MRQRVPPSSLMRSGDVASSVRRGRIEFDGEGSSMDRPVVFEAPAAIAALTLGLTACGGSDEPPVSNRPEGTASLTVDDETYVLDVSTCDGEGVAEFSLRASSEDGYFLEVTSLSEPDDPDPTGTVTFRPPGGFEWEQQSADLRIDANGVVGSGSDLRSFDGRQHDQHDWSLDAACP
jgi:hypothetical protein